MSDDDDDNGLKIVDLKIPPTDSQMGVADMRKNMDSMMAGHALLAKLLRAKYLALIDEGFTEKQALELSKKLEY